MEHLLFTLNVILPIILLILLGYVLKRIKFMKEDFIEEANKIVFKILIPITLFSNLYMADLSNIDWIFVGFGASLIIVIFLIGLIITLFLKEKKQKGVILQGLFSANYAIIGIPLVSSLAGVVGEVDASLMAVVCVPIFNILAVIALTVFDNEENNKVNVIDLLIKIIKNPLIQGVIAGIIVCLINMGIKALGFNIYDFLNNQIGFIPKTISTLKACTTPLALVVLGAKFEFTAVKKLWKHLLVVVSLRLFILPFIFLSIAYFIGFKSPSNFAILIAILATPIAVSSVPMTQQMNQDAELAGQIVVWTSVISAFSLFLIIYLCSQIGIFAI